MLVTQPNGDIAYAPVTTTADASTQFVADAYYVEEDSRTLRTLSVFKLVLVLQCVVHMGAFFMPLSAGMLLVTAYGVCACLFPSWNTMLTFSLLSALASLVLIACLGYYGGHNTVLYVYTSLSLVATGLAMRLCTLIGAAT